MSANLTVVQQSYIEWAEKLYGDQFATYQKYEDYYVGEHKLAFSTKKWEDTFGTIFEEFSDNWCQVVVDAMVQRMEIIGWEGDDKALAEQADNLFNDLGLGMEQDDLHTQTAVKGDGYMICWPDPEAEGDNSPQAYYNDAQEVNVEYSGQNRRKIIRASKKYQDNNGDIHLFIYYPEFVDHFIVPSQWTMAQLAAMGGSPFLTDETMPLPHGWYRAEGRFGNPYGRVPVIHFKNRAIGSTHGISELKVVVPIQNAINKLLMDMMVGSEFGSFRQKWVAAAAQPDQGWRAGAERLWATTDSTAKFGEFGQIDLEPMFKAVESLLGHVGKTTQTPMHFLRGVGDVPSGEALKTSESGLVKKVQNRQKHWGFQWSEVMHMLLWIANGNEPERPVRPVWRSPETRHELEQAQTAQLKAILGIPLEQLWKEHFGYTDDQIAEFKKLNLATFNAVIQQVIAQSGQLPPGATDMVAGSASGGVAAPNLTQVLALLGKGVTSQTPAGEATTKPQPNSRPPASPTRRSSGFKD